METKRKLRLVESISTDIKKRESICEELIISIGKLQRKSIADMVLAAAGEDGVITFNDETGMPELDTEGERYTESIVGIRYSWDHKDNTPSIEINVEVDENSDYGVNEKTWFDPYISEGTTVDEIDIALCIEEWAKEHCK